MIQHPKGNVLFDTGNNDKIITQPDYWGPFIKALDPGRSPDIAIDAQLKKINMTPNDIKYVVLGHFHVDHAGNIGKFLNSTFVYQRSEIRAAFWPAPGYAVFYKTDDFAMLRNDLGKSMPNKYKAIELDGDLDLFGDGSIIVKRSVSHTPGSQILVVRLPKTGTVVLPSDACYLKENLDGDILPSVGSVYNPEGMLDAYAFMKYLRDARAPTSSTPTIRTCSKRTSTPRTSTNSRDRAPWDLQPEALDVDQTCRRRSSRRQVLGSRTCRTSSSPTV